jgi:hypothetical protein
MTDTERINAMHQDARKAAEYYRANFWPVSYSVPHFVYGEWVRVTIEPDSQRMKPIQSKIPLEAGADKLIESSSE